MPLFDLSWAVVGVEFIESSTGRTFRVTKVIKEGDVIEAVTTLRTSLGPTEQRQAFYKEGSMYLMQIPSRFDRSDPL